MARSVGICPVCETKQLVSRNRIGLYVIRWHSNPAGPTEQQGERCSGTLLAPLPTPDQRRRESQRIALIEPFRAHAAVALDARLEYRPYSEHEVDILLDVACWWYSCCFTQVKPSAIVRYVARRGTYGARSARGDVYCMFCGDLLVSNIAGRRSFGVHPPSVERLQEIGRVSGHAVECALKHLAFALVPVSPDVRKLPEIYLTEAMMESQESA